MKVLMLRSWEPLSHAASFSTIGAVGVGGTELQLLQHARNLRLLGHEVTVFGVAKEASTLEGVFFERALGRAGTLEKIAAEYSDAQVVFLNVKHHLQDLRQMLPTATFIEVCQNGPNFHNDKFIDIYALVGFGQFAFYCTNAKRFRGKFALLPSVPPWERVYSQIPPIHPEEQITWVGSVNKQGVRRWAQAMSIVMRSAPALQWSVCGPSYDSTPNGRLPSAFVGIDLPLERVHFKNLPLAELALEIRSSLMVLSSLGGEDGPVSYLDGHALGVPVLCGDDIYGKYYNPEGMGFRCSTVDECVRAISFLLENPEAGREMGRIGRQWIEREFTETVQRAYIDRLMSYSSLRSRYSLPVKGSTQSDLKFPLRYWLERMEIKLALRLSRRK